MTRVRFRGLLVALGALACAVPAPAQAGDPVLQAGDRIAGAWTPAQLPDGRFPDYVKQTLGPRGRDTYAEGMLGAALLRWGILRRQPSWTRAGLRAVAYAVAHPSAPGSISRVFEDLALVEGYRAAGGRLRSRAQQRLFRAWQQRLRWVRVDRRSTRPFNQQLVLGVLAYETSLLALRSPYRGTILADRSGEHRRALGTLRTLLARMRVLQTQSSGGQQLALAGDEPDYPLAYHALCSALLARLADLGAGRELPGLRRQLEQLVLASALLSAPDGTLAYAGRSSEESWTLAMSAYAGRRAATGAGGWLAQVALARLIGRYRSPQWGLALVPALLQDRRRALDELDGYAAAVPYTGLTLLGLSWAQRWGAAPARAYSQTTIIGNQLYARIGVLNGPGVWAALRGGNALGNSGRTAPGLLGVKVRGPGGWQDVLAGRPLQVTPATQPGPGLLDATAPVGALGGQVRSSAGSLQLSGSYRRSAARPSRGALALTLSVLECGVRVQVAAVPGERVLVRLPVPGSNVQLGPDSAVWATGELHSPVAVELQAQAGSATVTYARTQLLVATSPPGQELDFLLLGSGCSSR